MRSNIRDRRICNQIGDGLRAQSFDVSNAGQAKPRGAACRIKLKQLNVHVMLDARRLPRTVKCRIVTWTSTSRWRQVAFQVVTDEWMRTVEGIERVLRQDLKATELSLLTKDELADQDERAEDTCS